MLPQFENYHIHTQLHKGLKTTIYRGVRKADLQAVILKVLTSSYPSTGEIAQLQQEYELLLQLRDSSGIVAVCDFWSHERRPVMVLEDIGGVSLRESLDQDGALTVTRFFTLALQMASAVGRVHAANVIHKDVNPSNFICNPGSGRLQLIDFSISAALSREVPALKNPNILEGTLAYISPEQTGRMNRSLDYRSDLYSLGVTFYELLTGHLPFEAVDAMEWVHAHMARQPVPPHKIADFSETVPPALSAIILKLMAKNAEDRYQSAAGLLFDLEYCRDHLDEPDVLAAFVPGQHDRSERFQIPEKLYGRQADIDRLLQKFAAVSQGEKSLVYFSGVSGIGKTALINELHKPMAQAGGVFIRGKYDALKKAIPYTAFNQAFTGLAEYLLTEDDPRFAQWKAAILKAVGGNGQIITDMVPEFEFILGKQPEVKPLPPKESQNRFNFVFQDFLRVFATQGHPLVLFLDDLQWADSASLNLLDTFFQDSELNYFLLIGAYRDNEVDKGHPFARLQEKMRHEGFPWEDIRLRPLAQEHIRHLIADTLHLEDKRTGALASLVAQKTGGTPFFVREFLKELYEKELLNFVDREWRWDLPQIEQAGITENVVEFLAEKLRQFPKETVQVLKVAACEGNVFNASIIAGIMELDKRTIRKHLNVVIDEGLVLKADGGDRFVHDRVREAAYSMLVPEERQQIHYRLGTMLHEKSSHPNQQDILFIIADHLNIAQPLLSATERQLLVEINFNAGKQAKESAAYEAANGFFRHGAELLPDNIWQRDYVTALNYYTEWAEAEYLSRNYSEAENKFAEILCYARTTLDKLRIVSIQIDYYTIQRRLPEVVEIGLRTLRELGEIFPKKPSLSVLMEEIEGMNNLLGERTVEELATLPVITDTSGIAKMRILMKLLPAFFLVREPLLAFAILRMLRLSLQYGNAPDSSYAYSVFFLVLKGPLQNIPLGLRYAKIGIELAHHYQSAWLKGMSLFNYSWIAHWTCPLRENLKHLEDSLYYSREAGNFSFMGYAFFNLAYTHLLLGRELSLVKDVHAQYTPLLKKLKQPYNEQVFNLWKQAALTLLGESDEPLRLTGAVFDEETILKARQDQRNSLTMTFFHVVKPLLCLLYENVPLGLQFAEQGEKLLLVVETTPLFPVFQFVYGMLLARHLHLLGNRNAAERLEKFKAIVGMFEKWAAQGPANYGHKYKLLAAELAALDGRDTKAMRLYEQSITEAREQGFTHEEALACEAASRFYAMRGINKIARVYMLDAYELYRFWGCRPKVRQLEAQYPYLSSRENFSAVWTDTSRLPVEDSTTTAVTGTGSMLDVNAVVKASQALSQEMRLERLLEALIQLVIANAGATSGTLLERRDDRWLVQARGSDELITTLQGVVVEDADDDEVMPLSVLYYTARALRPLIVNDVAGDQTYRSDPYIIAHAPKSLLCMPILHKGSLSAILYLENSLTPSAFTPERVELLNVLSSQAAISLENARYVEHLAEQERLQQEMELARRIQTAILPDSMTHRDFEIEAAMLPAEEVGGDYYDVLTGKDGSLWLAVGDVSGHGVTPGLIMIMAQTIHATLVMNEERSPDDVISVLNKMLYHNVQERLHESHHMTFTALKYAGNGYFDYAGSHDDMLIYRRSDDLCETIETNGIYLNLVPNIAEFTDTASFQLENGDVLFLYTDGVTEAENYERKLLNPSGFTEIIMRHINKNTAAMRDAILEDVLDWCDGRRTDDITLMVVRRVR